MDVGNASFNMLYNPEEKHYLTQIDNINTDDKNSSHSIILDYIPENSKVLDVGCSFGYLGKWLVKNKECKLFGIDIDKEGLKSIEEKGFYEAAFFIDLDKVILNDSEHKTVFDNIPNDFDYIICADLLEHLKNPTAILQLLKDKLAFGGQVIVSIPNISNIDIILNLIEGRFNYAPYGIMDNTHLRFFTQKSFMEWISTINKHSSESKFDLKLLGEVHIIPDTTLKLKEKYPSTVEKILEINPKLDILQNVFSLTKIEKSAKEIELVKKIREYRDYIEVLELGTIPNKVSRAINGSSIYEYVFENQRKGLCGLSILTASYGDRVIGSLIVKFFAEGEDQEPVFTKTLDISNLEDNKWLDIDIKDLKDMAKGKIKVVFSGEIQYGNLSIWLTDDDKPCMKAIYESNDFKLEKSTENYNVLKKLNDLLEDKKDNKGYIEDISGDNISTNIKYDKNSDKEVIKRLTLQNKQLSQDNKRLKAMVKELVEELI